jgi:hypothetical protein
MAAADPADAQVRSRQRAARGRIGAVWRGALAEHLAASQGVTAASRLLRRALGAGLRAARPVAAPVSANSVGEFAG